MQWVNADRAGGQATGYLDRDGVTVLIHVDGEPALLRVGPGQYLVWNRDVAARWGAYEAEEFEMRFVPRAWEMPIFDDGEIGS